MGDNMRFKLIINALLKYFFGLLIVGALLFLPAGSFNYWNAWLFIGVLFIPMFILGIVLMIKNPHLLELRLNIRESEKEQKIVILLSGIMFIAGFVVASLNYKYKWIVMPTMVPIISSLIFLFAYILYIIVLKENTYLARTIDVHDGQKLVDSGLYGIVRHPMYSSTIVLFLTIPLILGSIFSFVIFLAYPFIIMMRVKNEEEVLIRDLKGYLEYTKKVKYRLIPYIW